MRVLGIVGFMLVPALAWGADVSLVQHQAKDAGGVVHRDHDSFEEMRSFIRIEDEKIKDIKLLNLELEKATLLLKRREIETKLARLDKRHEVVPAGGTAGAGGRPAIRLSGIFMAGAKTEALLNVDGAYAYVREGDTIHEGEVVKAIRADGVTIEGKDGKKIVLIMDS